MNPLIQLIQIALGHRKALDAPLTQEEWSSTFKAAGKQAMLGVVWKGIERLPEEQLPPLSIKLKWAFTAEKIAERNGVMDTHSAEITREFSQMGLRTCILKGQGAALLYPWPEARQSGDIDLWVDGGHKNIVPKLRGKWNVGEVFYHHADVKAFADKTELEVHFHPTWMNSPFSNRKLQNYFHSKSSEQMNNACGKGFNHPTTAFNCIFSMMHIYRHLLQEGIGLRQLTDYYFILSNSTQSERKATFNFICRLGMKKFCGALMYVQKEIFCLEDEYLLCPADSDKGKFLLEEIWKSGNFGHYDSRNRYRKSQPALVRFFHRMRHLARFTDIAWSEIIWAPYFKIRQHIWRKLFKY